MHFETPKRLGVELAECVTCSWSWPAFPRRVCRHRARVPAQIPAVHRNPATIPIRPASLARHRCKAAVARMSRTSDRSRRALPALSHLQRNLGSCNRTPGWLHLHQAATHHLRPCPAAALAALHGPHRSCPLSRPLRVRPSTASHRFRTTTSVASSTRSAYLLKRPKSPLRPCHSSIMPPIRYHRNSPTPISSPYSNKRRKYPAAHLPPSRSPMVARLTRLSLIRRGHIQTLIRLDGR